MSLLRQFVNAVVLVVVTFVVCIPPNPASLVLYLASISCILGRAGLRVVSAEFRRPYQGRHTV